MRRVAELKVNGEWQEIRFVSRHVARRYTRRYGGRIDYIVLMTSQGLFDKLYDECGDLREIVGDID